MDDFYRVGSLWRHKTTDAIVRIQSTTEDIVWFVYYKSKDGEKPFTTSKPVFELFYLKVDLSEEGMIYLSEV